MRLIINTCYGGFSLSPKAVLEIYRRDPSALKSWSVDEYFGNQSDKARGMGAWRKYVADPVGHGPIHVFSPDETRVISSGRECDRASPTAIAVVEELGAEANGRCAELKIIEIPDGVNYTIEEYDGVEHVAEVHRTWS